MIAFALAADSKGSSSWGRMDFFLFVTVTSWLFVIAIFVLFALNVISVINVNIDWNLPVRVSYYGKNYIVEYGDIKPISQPFVWCYHLSQLSHLLQTPPAHGTWDGYIIQKTAVTNYCNPYP